MKKFKVIIVIIVIIVLTTLFILIRWTYIQPLVCPERIIINVMSGPIFDPYAVSAYDGDSVYDYLVFKIEGEIFKTKQKIIEIIFKKIYLEKICDKYTKRGFVY